MNSELFLVRESTRIVYGEDAFSSEKALIKAQFIAELNEQLRYPLSSIQMDVFVWVRDIGFEQIDVVFRNDQGDIVIVAALEVPREYERRQTIAMRSLYIKASVLNETERVCFLTYYTRRYYKGVFYREQLVVDYLAYPTYYAWQKARFPLVGMLPAYITNKEE